MPRYSIKLDAKMDAQNWYEACKNSSTLNDWSKQVDPTIFFRVQQLDKSEALAFLEDYVSQLYVQRSSDVKAYQDKIGNEFDQKFLEAYMTIEGITQKPLCREDFTFFLTTFPRGPYDYDKGHIWIAIGWFDPIKNFMHELLHFQFIHYWRNVDTCVSDLSEEQFEILKESLTVVLDKDIEPLIRTPDKGYSQHTDIRLKLHKNWAMYHNFSRLVDYGVTLVAQDQTSV